MKILLIIVIVIVVLIGGVSLMMFSNNQKIPKNLGVKDGKLAAMPSSPNAVSSQTEIEEKRVEPLPFNGDLTSSKSAILKVLERYGSVEIITNSDNYIHAVHTTKTMKFRDDLEFYFAEDERVIHFRSASRVGYSDRGLNRERYQKIASSYAELS